MNKYLFFVTLLLMSATKEALSENFSLKLVQSLNGYYAPSGILDYEEEHETVFYPNLPLEVNNSTVEINIYNDEFLPIEENIITNPLLTKEGTVTFRIGWKLPNSTRFLLVCNHSLSSGNFVYKSALVSFSGETLYTWDEQISDIIIYNRADKYFLIAYCFTMKDGKYHTYVYSIENTTSINSPKNNMANTTKKMTYDLNGIPVKNSSIGRFVISVMEDGNIVKSINYR